MWPMFKVKYFWATSWHSFLYKWTGKFVIWLIELHCFIDCYGVTCVMLLVYNENLYTFIYWSDFPCNKTNDNSHRKSLNIDCCRFF